ARPVRHVRFQRRRRIRVRPRQQPHRLEEREPVASGALRVLPVREHLLELVAIDLHPAPTHEREPMLLRGERFPFLDGQRLSVEGEMDVEIDERVEPEGWRLGATELYFDAYAGALLPPVRDADDDSRRFEGGDF